MQKRLLFLSFVLVLTLGILHAAALEHHFYWTYWWFDLVNHFLGGFSIGFFILWCTSRLGLWSFGSGFLRPILLSVFLMFIVGVGWEVFEYVNGLTQSTEAYALDVLYDLIADLLGALCAGLIAPRSLHTNDVQH